MLQRSPMVIIERPGKPPLKSMNLRGVLSYHRRPGVYATRIAMDVHRSNGQAYLHITWSDGAHCRTEFADWRVLRKFVRSRTGNRRNACWGGAEVLDLLPMEG